VCFRSREQEKERENIGKSEMREIEKEREGGRVCMRKREKKK